jgi:predicted XRE-type DNA-binding protein
MTVPITTNEIVHSIGQPAEQANLIARSQLMREVTVQVRSWNVTQEAAAHRLGINRPRLNNLLRGKIAKFSLDSLLNLAVHSGLSVKIEVGDAAKRELD